MTKSASPILTQIQDQITLSLLEQKPSSFNQLFASNRLPCSVSHACQTAKTQIHPGRTASLERCRAAQKNGFLAIDFVIVKHTGLEIEGLSFNYASTQKRPISSHSYVSSAIVYPKDRLGYAPDPIAHRLEPHISQDLATPDYPYQKATEEMLKTATQARNDGIAFEAVLVDGEFTSKESLNGLAKAGIAIIGRYRTDVNVEFEGETLSIKALAQRFPPGKAHYYNHFGCYVKRVKVLIPGVGTIALIFIWKRVSDGLDLCVLVSTYEGGVQTILAAWKARWALEVCHRLYKQNFGLGKCQAQSFATQLLHSSLVLRAFHEVCLVRRLSPFLPWRVAQVITAEKFKNTVVTEYSRVIA
jgi:hypothetical protein